MKEEFEVWEDKPNLIQSENMLQPKQAWIPSLFNLEHHKQIVRVDVEAMYSEQTRIQGRVWTKLKKDAMKPNYKMTD